MSTPLPSNRSFGWTFTGVFALVAFFQPWLLALAALTAIVTLARTHWLAPFNRAWMKLAEVLHRVVSPVVLGLIFFGLFTPVAMLMRAFGRDALNRRTDAQLASYWIRRDPPGPRDDSFRNMF
jgi:hypothetical protein